MASTLREFVTKWGFDVDDAQLKKIDDSVSRTQKNIQATARAAVNLGQRLTLGVTLPFVGISAASVKAASDAEETLNKFNVVFAGVSAQSAQTAKDLASNFGLSQTAAQGLLADTGDLLTGFGFTQQSALDLSTQVQKLAVDLASFTNFSGGAEGASAALTKALLGERESVKALGISILEDDVKAKIEALKASGRFTNETEREQKAIATLEIALSQSKNAIGDFARSQNSLANQSRVLRARVNDVAVQFGQILLPFATKVITALSKLVERFGNLSKGAKTFILVLGGVAAAIGPLLIIVGTLVNTFLTLRTALLLVQASALKTFAIILAKVLLVAAAVAAAFVVFDDLKAFFEGRDSVFGLIIKQIDDLLMKFQEAFPILSTIVLTFVNTVTAPIKAVIGLVRGVSAALGTLFGGGGFRDALKNFGVEFGGAFSGFGKAARGETQTTSDLLGISGIRQEPRVQAPGANRAGGTVNQNVNAPVTVNVPPGTPPEAVGPAVQSGVKEALGQQLREAGRQAQGAIEV